MADYWKSNPRHYCKYCDCWIADNKPSRDFHERGKKHQEMVKKKIDEIKKKSRADEKADKEMESTMKRIERKAMASFKKDLQQNPILQRAVQEKNKQKREAEEAAEAAKPPVVLGCEPPPKELQVKQTPRNWKILFNEDGYPYFWNQETNEVQWTKPDDFVPEHENRYGEEDNTAVGTDSAEKPEESAPAPEESTSQQEEEKSEEKVDPLPPVPTSEIPLPPPPGTEAPIVPTPEPEPVPEPEPEPERVERKRPMPSNKAYGQWEQMAESTQEERTDLQLPDVEKPEQKVLVSNVNEPKIKFRTKTANPIADGLAAFKKRKLTQGARNIKKREDDR